METVTVTSRHWYRESLSESFRPIELRDGALAVDIRHPEDHESFVTIVVHGEREAVRCFCGPGAPYPSPILRLIDGRGLDLGIWVPDGPFRDRIGR